MLHAIAPPQRHEPSTGRLPQPTFDHVLIEPLDEKITTAIPGFVVPDMVKDKPTQGRIVAVGPGRKTPDGQRVTVDFEVGNMVAFNSFSGKEIRFSQKLYLIVPEQEIFCTL